MNLSQYFPILVVVASVFIPSALAVVFLWLYRKWQDRDGRRSPLSNKRIYGAGEQLRKRIEDEADSMMGGLVVLFFLGPYFLAAWALKKLDWHTIRFGWSEAIYLVAFFAMAIWAVHRIIRHGSRRRRGIAGLKAEMFTAQELNRLIGAGCSGCRVAPAGASGRPSSGLPKPSITRPSR